MNAGFGNHEGGSDVIRFRPSKSPLSILFYDGELTYTIVNGDTTLILTEHHIKTNKLITTKYKKAVNKQPDDRLDFGMNYLVNKGIIGGKYLCIDSTGHQSNVMFTNDGRVTALANFKTYFISTDIGGEPMNNLDGIIFERIDKTRQFFTFNINADTLKLYDTYANTDSTEYIVGRLKYRLVKKK
ncbi:hypothetical protein [Mucilaginibacter sp. UR6-11]|uniref:hypothetical protein n=1 Tax=Mucilaginibacter sp. UR6-11 TaxID=1435644 RepID=UPI001E37D1CC|nr:hypothetical protein [Mucilaginibacter sp. UR6-11]MCC8424233.1 hypothetical protein [Mucilaginibacter sp. UR6-11]